ncbi:DUF1622 domain-containing protein [Aquimarina sp. ERC-38]|uniref:DUF1622 domain-containing protein n=1 Tax=Aquimarina sp. ERC-38 TaxID=2949996 RepID=UPI002245695C|nr:DUF1622 domain-containing protein [Aquimarina sp. ERC-38]UZO79286.1 DUF1622 domain-containing protein [Aquimarina sp. ERC-38]
MEHISEYIEYAAKGIEIIGILVIIVGTLLALLQYVSHLFSAKEKSYLKLRHQLGKAILLGLEILVAADIIATVVTEPTMNKVLTLGVVVLIRTFLSLSLQVEIEGKFPWQSSKTNNLKE